MEDIWPHLGLITQEAEAQGCVDEVELLLQKQIKLVQFQYKSAFDPICNKEEFERVELRQRQAEQQAIVRERYQMYFNFRLWLLEAFVRINRWDLVEDIIGRLYQWKLDLTLHPPLLHSMIEAVDWMIEPLHKQIIKGHKFFSTHCKASPDSQFYPKNSAGLRQADTSKVLFEELPKVIKVLNVNIAFN